MFRSEGAPEPLPVLPDLSGGLVQLLVRLTVVCCALVVALGCGGPRGLAAAPPPGNCPAPGETVPFGRVMSHTTSYTDCPVATEAAFMTSNACVAIRAEAGEECFMFVPPNTTFGGGMPSAAPRTVIARTEAANQLYSAKQGALYRLVGTTRISEQTPAANAFVAASIEPVPDATTPTAPPTNAGGAVPPATPMQSQPTQAPSAPQSSSGDVPSGVLPMSPDQPRQP